MESFYQHEVTEALDLLKPTEGEQRAFENLLSQQYNEEDGNNSGGGCSAVESHSNSEEEDEWGGVITKKRLHELTELAEGRDQMFAVKVSFYQMGFRGIIRCRFLNRGGEPSISFSLKTRPTRWRC